MRVIVIVLVLLAASVAYAEPPRYARKPSVAIPVKPSPRVKQRPRPAATLPRGPLVTADDVLASHRRAQPFRVQQEAILERLVEDTPDDDPDKPELLFRLAEHYAQQLRFWRLQATAPTLPAGAR